MMTKHATPADFSKWTERAAAMTVAALDYSIRDCVEAANACDSFDPVRAGKLRDEAATYRAELNAR